MQPRAKITDRNFYIWLLECCGAMTGIWDRAQGSPPFPMRSESFTSQELSLLRKLFNVDLSLEGLAERATSQQREAMENVTQCMEEIGQELGKTDPNRDKVAPWLLILKYKLLELNAIPREDKSLHLLEDGDKKFLTEVKNIILGLPLAENAETKQEKTETLLEPPTVLPSIETKAENNSSKEKEGDVFCVERLEVVARALYSINDAQQLVSPQTCPPQEIKALKNLVQVDVNVFSTRVEQAIHQCIEHADVQTLRNLTGTRSSEHVTIQDMKKKLRGVLVVARLAYADDDQKAQEWRRLVDFATQVQTKERLAQRERFLSGPSSSEQATCALVQLIKAERFIKRSITNIQGWSEKDMSQLDSLKIGDVLNSLVRQLATFDEASQKIQSTGKIEYKDVPPPPVVSVRPEVKRESYSALEREPENNFPLRIRPSRYATEFAGWSIALATALAFPLAAILVSTMGIAIGFGVPAALLLCVVVVSLIKKALADCADRAPQEPASSAAPQASAPAGDHRVSGVPHLHLSKAATPAQSETKQQTVSVEQKRGDALRKKDESCGASLGGLFANTPLAAPYAPSSTPVVSLMAGGRR